VEKSKLFGSVVVYDGQSDVLPQSVMNWLGIDDNNPALEDDKRAAIAADWNDGVTVDKADFAKIADLLTKKYLDGPGK
jgi:hypothetical protein